MPDKPDALALVTDEFKTPAQRAAARDILLLWPAIKNFAEISRRTGWSEPHLRSVFETYFEAAEGGAEPAQPEDADIIDTAPETMLTDREAYREGYRDGYQDGQADAQES